jgi:hypothetical protein
MRALTTESSAAGGTWENAAARAFALSCFFPYPALALGGNTGLQVSQGLALAGAPFLCARSPGKPLLALLLLLVPVYLSALLALVSGESPSAAVLQKESVALTLAFLVLWPSEWVAVRDRFRLVLAAAGAAVVVHAAIGPYQVYSFAKGEFPLLFPYKNPSFKSMEEWAKVYVTYIQRPCGLFPEPSAMAASLSPWLVLLAGLLIDPARAQALGWKGRRLATAAVAFGFLLIALSRSGSAFPTTAAVAALCAAKVPGWSRSFGVRKFLTLAVVLAAALGVGGHAAYRLSGGLEDRVESSWGLRALSIEAGLSANTDPMTLAVGVGPGQSTPVVRRQLAWVPLPEDQDELAVFSLAVCYYMETGLIGAPALAAVLAMALRAVVRSSAVVLGVCSLGSWLVGVTATTIYMALSAVGLFLGVRLTWDRLFPQRAAAAPGARS